MGFFGFFNSFLNCFLDILRLLFFGSYCFLGVTVLGGYCFGGLLCFFGVVVRIASVSVKLMSEQRYLEQVREINQAFSLVGLKRGICLLLFWFVWFFLSKFVFFCML